MSGARVKIDGLWRCLCPSIDATLTRCITSASRHPRPRRVAAAASPRCLHSSGRLFESGAKPKEDPFASLSAGTHEKGVSKRQISPDWLQQGRPREQSLENATSRSPDEENWDLDSLVDGPVERTIENKPSTYLDDLVVSSNALESQFDPTDMVQRLIWGKRLAEDIPRATTEQIYEALRKLRTLGKPKYRRATAVLVRHLLASGEAPDTFIYETLLLAHAATDGSADAVKDLLLEMRHKKLPWSSTAYHAALQVRTAQPDAAVSSY
jgi:hypothetical protein